MIKMRSLIGCFLLSLRGGLTLLSLVATSSLAQDDSVNDALAALFWEPKATFPGGGRHHPIAFANTTHGFVLTGTSSSSSYTSEFWSYDANSNSWLDLSNTPSKFPGMARSFGYGVASTTNCSNSKAYVGFGRGATGDRLTDFWEFDMASLKWRRLAEFPGLGRRHPAMNYAEPVHEIHVGLGDGTGGNYNDWWAYSIQTDTWRQLPNLPGVPRHHPFYFAIGTNSYVGLGHSSSGIERDWYRWDCLDGAWMLEDDFASYSMTDPSTLVTTEARVAGTEFSTSGSCDSMDKVYGFVLSGDGDDHGTIQTGEFHLFSPYDADGKVGVGTWHPLPPHPGFSRWAPGSFVLQGSSRVYFIGGYDRTSRVLYDDMWMMDLSPLFDAMAEQSTSPESLLPETIVGSPSMLPTSAATVSPEATLPPTSAATISPEAILPPTNSGSSSMPTTSPDSSTAESLLSGHSAAFLCGAGTFLLGVMLL